MKARYRIWIVPVAVVAFLAGAAPAGAQQSEAGKDALKLQATKGLSGAQVPDAVVRRMLELGKVGPKDHVVDLGSGDARIVIVAARDFGARAMGVAPETAMVEAWRKAAAVAGVGSRVRFRRADIFAIEFATDFSSATVVTAGLPPQLMLRLRPQILDLRPGTRVLSRSSDLGDWRPDQEEQAGGHSIYAWTVPAKVGGTWTVQQPDGPFELVLIQDFQKLLGKAAAAGAALQVLDPSIEGDQITFAIARPDGSKREYAGRVSGRQMQGSMTDPGSPGLSWSAAKK